MIFINAGLIVSFVDNFIENSTIVRTDIELRVSRVD